MADDRHQRQHQPHPEGAPRHQAPPPEPRTGRDGTGVGRRAALLGAAGVTMAAASASAAFAAGPEAADGAKAGRRPSGRYRGKTVLITGATSGIGRAAALAFAAEGARVGFCGRREHLGRQLEREIRAKGGEATYFRTDVRHPEQVVSFVDRVAHRYGGLDVAMNNAGVQHVRRLSAMTVQEWDDTFATNTRAVFVGIKEQARHMKARGGGVILVTGSSNEFATRPQIGGYTASKSALTGLVRNAAIEYGADGIRVVALSPGTTDTALLDAHRPAGLTDEQWAAEKKRFGENNVDGLRRIAAPEEMATAALALASPDMSFQTGTSVLVDGGALAGL
ncbi:glucose 1-dehydrogenase [Streptomyces capparidis]